MSSYVPNTLSVYHNLLILEASFRKTYLQLQVRRQKYMAFYVSLLVWNFYFGYRVFYRISKYSLIDLTYKLCLLCGIVTLLLFYFSGLYRTTIVYPSRYVQQVNKAMRFFNIRLVITPVPWFQVRKPLDCGVHLILSSKRFDILVIEGWEAFRSSYFASIHRKNNSIQSNESSESPSSKQN
ncbi:serine/threonine protein phosphatase (Nem1-Spo7 complex) regulatory subunit [Schizosaccharomyces pombe]|uniref:Sporulation-specific protein spo7 n=1 Tax=Schizosaccharomyces pombe (strain 972 / ATCC 24843) TaxID=284812 RepID=SPO7_SCHPO|nr:sporulation-specific protein [Schizosaccharomyces pombe]Q9USQ0.1 RecName: Full=Sporulation-specific protein spo7 [Schizosaccharomyces pombe 972h-]CAB62097.1 Nem1-Spo7 complex regulatory subunit Spo7 (predicted) [Schizosaccharomyces pombe]|eukprot:NP_595201.1 sporulation-specific protein [Schizosaccharomyces pombe]